MLALGTWLWWLRRDPAAALDNAIALLIVTCPCALALATPLAITAAIGKAAHAGLLIKGGDALEVLGRPSRLVLDKTGTLTEGRTTLVVVGRDPAGSVRSSSRSSATPTTRSPPASWRPGPAMAEAITDGVTQIMGGGVEGVANGRASRWALPRSSRPAPATRTGSCPGGTRR